MLILVIGGVGWLYGGVAGAIVFKLMQDAIPASRRNTGPSGSVCSGVLVLVGRERLIPLTLEFAE